MQMHLSTPCITMSRDISFARPEEDAGREYSSEQFYLAQQRRGHAHKLPLLRPPRHVGPTWPMVHTFTSDRSCLLRNWLASRAVWLHLQVLGPLIVMMLVDAREISRPLNGRTRTATFTDDIFLG